VALLSSTRAALVELLLREVPWMRFRMAVYPGLFWVEQSRIHRPRVSNQKWSRNANSKIRGSRALVTAPKFPDPYAVDTP
jgi:hypothetical protein